MADETPTAPASGNSTTGIPTGVNPTRPESPTIEIGTTGLVRYSGLVSEEFLTELKGQRGVMVFKEMRDNDAAVGAIIFAIEMIIRQLEWVVKPSDPNNPDDIDFAKFVDECIDDLDDTWPELMVEILSMLVFGWSYFEVVYKMREGEETDDPTRRSKFDDGKIGWRKIAIRAQETLVRWEFSKNGDILGLWQLAPPDYRLCFIPIGKALHFRTTRHKNNPEGRSILRNAYRAWYYKKRIENIEAIGVERDLAGFPVIKVPAKIMAANASDAEKQLLADYIKIVTNIRRDDQEGLVLPSDVYPDSGGRPLYSLELLSTNSRRNFDTGAIINRKANEIMMTVLADFIALGHEQTGTFALSKDKTDMFAVAIRGWIGMVKDTITRDGLSKLRELNGFKGNAYLEIANMEDEAISTIIDSIVKLANVGAEMFPDDDLENLLRRRLGLPPKSGEMRTVGADDAEDFSNADDEGDSDGEAGDNGRETPPPANRGGTDAGRDQRKNGPVED